MPLPDDRTDVAAIVLGLRRITKALEEYSREVHRAYGLTAPQLWALKTLFQRGSLTSGELADALIVHQSSVSVLIGRLERRRLVRRVRRQEDRRFVVIELTPEGEALARSAPEPAQGRLLHRLAELEGDQLRRLREAVGTLVAAMEAEETDARFFFLSSEKE